MMRAANGRRVLVACRDTDMRRICHECLGHVGYDVTTVEDPDHALTTILRVRPHLVITSFPTTTSTGQSVTQVIRADADVREMPILSLASWVRPDELARARSAGVTESVPIPVPLDALIGTVRRLIGPVTPVPAFRVDGRSLAASGQGASPSGKLESGRGRGVA